MYPKKIINANFINLINFTKKPNLISLNLLSSEHFLGIIQKICIYKMYLHTDFFMNNRINYPPSFEIGNESKKYSKKENFKFSSEYDKNFISKRYVNFIEELIKDGRVDKAQELVLRADRFPNDYTNYLRKYSIEEFKNYFPNLRKTGYKS